VKRQSWVQIMPALACSDPAGKGLPAPRGACGPASPLAGVSLAAAAGRFAKMLRGGLVGVPCRTHIAAIPEAASWTGIPEWRRGRRSRGHGL